MPTNLHCYLHLLIIIMPLCACFETTKHNFSEESVFEKEERRFEECFSKNKLNCIKTLILQPIEDIWQNGEVKLIDSVFIEQVFLEDNSSWDSGRGSSGDAGNGTKTRALRLDFGNWGSLQVARSAKNPKNLEFALRMATGSRGKRSDALKIAVPLMMGFKMTGMLIVAIIAIKILLVKALLVSKVALLVAGYLVVRQLLSSRLSNQHMNSHHHQYPLSYYHQPHQGLEAAAIADYGYYGYGKSGNEETDLQAHFSGNVPETIVPAIASSEATNHTGSRRNGVRRQPGISLVKSRLNPVSIVTYRKVTHTGRSAGAASSAVQSNM